MPEKFFMPDISASDPLKLLLMSSLEIKMIPLSELHLLLALMLQRQRLHQLYHHLLLR